MMVKIKEEVIEDETSSPGRSGSASMMPLVFVDCSAEIKEEVTTVSDNYAPYLEASHDVPSMSFNEQNPVPSQRISHNLTAGLPSIPQPAASTSQDVTNLPVKIKEEITEYVIHSPDASMGCRQHFFPETDLSPVLKGSSVFSGEIINFKVEDDLSEESVVSKENGQLDFTKTDKEMEVEDTSIDCRQHFLPETDLSPAFKGSSAFPGDMFYFKVEDDLAKECYVSKENGHLDIRNSEKEMEVEGMHHTKLSFMSCSDSNEFQSFETPARGADITQALEIKTEHFDVAPDNAAHVLLEPDSRLSNCAENLASGSVHFPPSMSSVSAYNPMKYTEKGAAQNHTESLCYEKPSSFNQCPAPCSFNSYSLTLDSASCWEKPFSCHLCSAGFSRKFNLKRHLFFHYNEKAFSCDQCSARFGEISHLKQHLLIHSNKKAVSCDQCSAQFKGKSDLKRHLLTHSNEKTFSCDHCSAQFKRKDDFNQHFLTHSNKKMFTCDHCSAQFIRKSCLRDHLLIHSNEKAFSCEQCSARFKRSRDLKQHFFTHSNERAFSCDQCSAQFKRKGDLQKHLSIHSSKKMFTCDQCSAQFIRKSCLRDHLLIHSNEKAFSCEQCSARFKRSRDLKQHSFTHSNERAFPCDQCSARFNRKSSLRRHMITHSY